MYLTFLSLHSVLRWIVVLLAALATARAASGWLKGRNWTPLDDRLGLAFTIVLDTQVLIGLILYLFLSPVTASAFHDLGVVLSNDTARFWIIEHIFAMVVSLILVHIGRSMSGRPGPARQRYQRTALLFGLATLILIISIPWPFMPAGAGRPWIRIG